jgi:PAS domain S-box-containing protein
VLFDEGDRVRWCSRAAAANARGEPDAFIGRHLDDPPFGPAPAALHEAITASRRERTAQYVTYHSRVMAADIAVSVIPLADGYAVAARAVHRSGDPDMRGLLDDAGMRFLARETSDVLVLHDETGRICHVSPSVTHVLGYEPQAIVGMNAGELMHPDDQPPAFASFQRALQSGALGRTEFRVRDARGDWRDISATGFRRLGDAPGTHFVGIWQDVTARRLVEQAQGAANARLRELVHRVDQARAEEKARAARELHDRVGQALTLARIGAQRLAEHPDAAAVAAPLADLVGDIDAAIAAARAVTEELRPPLLDEFGLAAALEHEVVRVCARAGIAHELALDEVALPVDVARRLFAVAQEALTNVVRHAGARTVRVQLAAHGGGVTLSVRDDGTGFQSDQLHDPQALGLLGMQERMSAIDGSLSVQGSRGAGTTIIATAPVPAGETPA